ncbi:MAG TPA: serine/threonine-protein kinase [Polyangiaceae bacterium]|nr:serine/threonine-protein kinase [Polyangiaceae bacterium]
MRERAESLSYEPGAVLPGPGYRLVRRLGRGGMGSVYEAEHPATGERVALKVVSAAVAAGPGGAAVEARLVRETQALAAVASPHVVRVLEAGRLDDGRPYYTMPLLEGETLRELVRRGPLAPPLACGLGSQALEALDAVHAAELVHRDVKPANLFLRADGLLILLDFGLVKVPDGDERFTPLGFSTGGSRALGTTRYLPPELFAGAAPDRRADLYAAGVVLVELLTGRLPLAHCGDDQYVAWLRRRGFPTPYDGPGAPLVPDVLRPVLDRATARDPDQRYQTAREFALDLHWACLRGGFDVAGARPTPAPARPAARPGVAAHVVLVVACSAASALAGATALAPRASAPIAAEPRAPAPERPAAAALPPGSAAVAAEVPTAEVPTAEASSVPHPSAPRAKADRRAELEARLRAGRGTIEDAREFAWLCDDAGDRACRERARGYLKRFAGMR